MKALTDRQAEVMSIVMALYEDNGYPPTHREVAEKFGYRAPEYVREQILALQRKGYLDVTFNASRAIKVLRNAEGVHVQLKFVPLSLCTGCGDPLGDDVRHSEITDEPFCLSCVEEARKGGSAEFLDGADYE